MSSHTTCDQCKERCQSFGASFSGWTLTQRHTTYNTALGHVPGAGQGPWDFCSYRCLEEWARERAH